MEMRAGPGFGGMGAQGPMAARSCARRRQTAGPVPLGGPAETPGQAVPGLGGGTGTSQTRDAAPATVISGQDLPGAWATSTPGRSRMRIIRSPPAAGTAGARWPSACRALLSAQQSAHGLAGSNVSLTAATTDSLLA
jgi:hypothetical protein